MDINVIASATEAIAVYDEVTVLFQVAFGREIDFKEWSHYYFANPYGDPIVALGYKHGRLVGHHALIPQLLVDADGKHHAYYLAISLMVHPDHRGFPAFHALVSATTARARERHAPFILGFPNANSFALFQRCFGWKLLLETDLYNWRPDRRATRRAEVVPLEHFALSSELGHPFDPTYRRWRSRDMPYAAVMVNGRFEIMYKLLDDQVLTVLDVRTAQQDFAAYDLDGLTAYTGAETVRLTGVHAGMIGLDPAMLQRHTNYKLRMCCAPIVGPVLKPRFSLLLTDIF